MPNAMAQPDNEARWTAQLNDLVAIGRLDAEDPCHNSLEIARQLQLGEHGQIWPTLPIGDCGLTRLGVRPRRVQMNLEPAINGQVGHPAEAALPNRLVDVLSVIPRDPLIEFKNDLIEAFVGAGTDGDGSLSLNPPPQPATARQMASIAALFRGVCIPLPCSTCSVFRLPGDLPESSARSASSTPSPENKGAGGETNPSRFPAPFLPSTMHLAQTPLLSVIPALPHSVYRAGFVVSAKSCY